jgi:hypothetical protein
MGFVMTPLTCKDLLREGFSNRKKVRPSAKPLIFWMIPKPLSKAVIINMLSLLKDKLWSQLSIGYFIPFIPCWPIAHHAGKSRTLTLPVFRLWRMQDGKDTGTFAFGYPGNCDQPSFFTSRAPGDIDTGKPEHYLLNRLVDRFWQLVALPEQSST